MKLFLIEQYQNNSWDSYERAVVAAQDEQTAKHMHPMTGKQIEDWPCELLAWCSGPEHVIVRYLGEAADDLEQGVVCASFRSG